MSEKIFISIDTGASANKVAYRVKNETKFLTSSPYCAEVSEATVQSRSALTDIALPGLDEGWVSDSDCHYLLGMGARKFFGEVLDGDRKFEKALYKILGVLAYVTTVEDIIDPIDVGILLPFDEYATKFELERRLRRVVSQGFKYCDRPQHLGLNSVTIRPEGAGTFLSGLKSGKQDDGMIGSLVVGHRNASWLVIRKGTPQKDLCETCDFGFRWLVNEVRSLTGYKDEYAIAEQISQKREMPQDMCLAVEQALPQYWSILKSWLRQQAPVSHVVASGGAAIFLKPYLKEIYGPKVSWADHLATDIYGLGVKDKTLVRRLTDCYGLLLSMEGNDA